MPPTRDVLHGTAKLLSQKLYTMNPIAQLRAPRWGPSTVETRPLASIGRRPGCVRRQGRARIENHRAQSHRNAFKPRFSLVRVVRALNDDGEDGSSIEVDGGAGGDAVEGNVGEHVASSDESTISSQSDAPPTPAPTVEDKIEATLADLDALLGIHEESDEEEAASPDALQPQMSVQVAPGVLEAIAEAERKRAGATGQEGGPELSKNVNDSIGRIVEMARKQSQEAGEQTPGEEAMRKEFEQLLSALTSPRGLSGEEIDEMKNKVFGPQTYFVTEVLPVVEFEQGILVRGNFRGDRTKKYREICDKVAQLYGEKYIVRMVEERDLTLDSEDGEPRVSLQVIPADAAMKPDAQGWQRALAFVLVGLTLVSSLQLGVTSNVGLLPRETLLWLANPENLNADILPPGLENFDPLPFVESAIMVGGTTLVPQLAHEVGHIIAALALGIKTGPSYLVPNGQLGTFGSITQIKNLAKNKSDLFDFASAGLLGGFVASLVLFTVGLVVSSQGGGAEAGLVPVPVQLFQGSLVLGSICKSLIGGDPSNTTNVFVSPLLIGGWCGLVSFAFNALPVGTLDGGRTIMAAYGRTALAFTSLSSYIGLGLGVLGNALALPFGLYLLICQRESERRIQDDVTEVDDKRKALALGIVAVAVMILLPGVPDKVDLALSTGSFL